MEPATTEGPQLISPRRRSLLAVAAAVLPLLVAGVRAATSSWVPIVDDAYFTARSIDVATAHQPLLGAWSSGSVAIARQVNNLGPLQLDLMAPFTKVAPIGGTVIGAIAVHLASVVTVAWLVSRLADHAAVLPAMAAISLSTWMLVALLALGLAVLVAVHRRRDVDQNRAGVIDQSHLYLGHRFGYTMGVVLQDRGIEYRLEGSMQARRFGESRVADGSEPERPVLWHGDEARQRPVVRNLFAYVAGRDQSVVLLETDKPR